MCRRVGGLQGWGQDSFYAMRTGVLVTGDEISKDPKHKQNPLPYILAAEMKWHFSRKVLNYCKMETDFHSSHFQ